ncbi:molybdenum cofactor biosynthesis protein MoaE [Niabella pedocola]|uniref:Molybdopterin synthase catalytic subunit n=1 Tax=Niabella pedocola TaxID=1752077 RepID=A0ABS8PJZ4_9BACT|nr:molybdenum cofactor biosynthesis protein MoaE [Niabella pedocola]MCD2421413.1 molybdenum cofactor biosynthesis protein MoaE [Niabella pedocola]
MIDIKLSDTPLDMAACIGNAADDACGGQVIFAGTVRNKTKGRRVLRLEYECYQSMALKEIKKIAENAIRLWDIRRIVIHHRVGVLGIGDTAVVIVVSAPHREAAFEGCRYAIETLKKTVPIWKKEIFEDGEEWVSAHT